MSLLLRILAFAALSTAFLFTVASWVMRRRTRQRSRLHLYAAIGVLSAAAHAETNDWGQPAAEQSAGVSVRSGCKIAHFGEYPWAPRTAAWTAERRSATVAALVLMDIPLATAEKAAEAMEHTPPDKVLDVGNAGATERVPAWENRPAITYNAFHTSFKSDASGRVVCRASRTAFKDEGQSEKANVWTIDGYVVGHFRVCQNVSRFFAGPLLKPLTPTVYTVPEPGSLALVLLGLGALALRRKS